MLHSLGDFERISDHAVNVLESAQEMREKNLKFSPEAQENLLLLGDALTEILDLAITSFTTEDINTAIQVEPLEQVIDDMELHMKARHIQRLQEGKCTIELGFIYSDVLTVLERVSDHCSNIAAYQIGFTQEQVGTHAYLNSIKTGNDKKFIEMYKLYQEKYMKRIQD